MATDPSCPFCAIIEDDDPAMIVDHGARWLAIVPLNPVVPGHLLVLPTIHVPDATSVPSITASTMHAAAQLAVPPCDIITSVGAQATQTVRHLHIHIVPRASGDGLLLPWSNQ